MGFATHLQPQIIICHELHDFYALSRFNKDPARLDSLQDEIDIVYNILKKLRKKCPDTRIIMLSSNHTDRLQKYLWSDATGLSSLRALKLPSLMRLKELSIEYRPHFKHKGFLFKHGSLVRRHSGYTARHEMDREGMSGQSGHTHRCSAYYVTKRGGSYTWSEAGCLCDLQPEYIDGVADWQHGVGLVSFEKKGVQFYARTIPIIEYRLMWGDITISAT